MTPLCDPRPAAGSIARLWRARAEKSDVPAYLAHLAAHVFPLLQSIPGYRGGFALEGLETPVTSRGEASPVEIHVVTLWDSLDAIRAFAGEDHRRAVVAPAAQSLLVDYENLVTHFTVRAEDHRT